MCANSFCVHCGISLRNSNKEIKTKPGNLMLLNCLPGAHTVRTASLRDDDTGAFATDFPIRRSCRNACTGGGPSSSGSVAVC